MAIDNFSIFAKMVATAFQAMAKTEVYVTDVEGDVLYQRYLSSFPAGTNPIFKKQTEHDCSCCRHFMRRAGNAVSMDNDGSIRTIWDEAAREAPYPYNVVAATLRDDVLGANVSDLYRVGLKEGSFGAAVTRSIDTDSNKVFTWNHFYTDEIPGQLRCLSPDEVRGEYRTTVQVFTRGLVELAPSALETVLSLIDANNLYRGAEHRAAVVKFIGAQKAFQAHGPKEQAIFAWTYATGPASRFRNTVIGTLVQDLGDGVEIDRAVASFEQKVAPTNYKRTTAVITPAMVKKAMETIELLGLEPALERRFATIKDISVNDVRWVDGSVKPAMKGGIGDVLMKVATTASSHSTHKDEEQAEDIGLEAFVDHVLPLVTSMEVLFKSKHLGNLMSLTAPVHAENRQLFRWDNDFAWSYGGNVADSISERVKKAGGKVEGAVLRVSLSWFNYDDLDLHIKGPTAQHNDHIYFAQKIGKSGGELDVDMNAGSGKTREAVENIVWMKKMPDGLYKVTVHNFSKRETQDPGFVIEVESAGKLLHFNFNMNAVDQAYNDVVTLHMKDGLIDRIENTNPAISTSSISQNKWGLSTEQYIKVNAVTLSPNYWGDNAVGNKHTFFVLDGAENDEPTRGIYNEFLHSRLESHRKVFEVIGEKTKCQPTEGQLSGLGFSSTKRTNILVKVQQGSRRRFLNVQVGS
jgi:hypothetical protein